MSTYICSTTSGLPGGRLWAQGRPLMGRFEVELTERCNNDCVHCYVNRPAADRASRDREQPAAAVIERLKEAAVLGALAVRFTGGEPLLRDDFPEIYLAARRLGMVVELLTNACLVTERIAALFERTPPLEPVSVTVYGMSERSYEAVTRTPGSYRQMRRGVRRLADHGVRLALKGTLLSQTASEVDDLRGWARALHAPPPTFVTYLHSRLAGDEPERGGAIAALRRSPDELADFYLRSEARPEAGGEWLGTRGEQLFICSAGQTVCMDARGDLLPCLLVRHPDVVYDLSRGSLEEAVSEFFPALRRRKATERAYLERCARCFLGALCEQCPAWSWSEHGTLDTPVEYLCECAHRRARGLGLVPPGERSWEIEDPRGRSMRR